MVREAEISCTPAHLPFFFPQPLHFCSLAYHMWGGLGESVCTCPQSQRGWVSLSAERQMLPHGAIRAWTSHPSSL